MGMRIGQVADASGLSTGALRFYERVGLLPGPTRTASGYRDYSDDVVGRLDFIHACQRVGLTLAEIREILDYRDGGTAPCEHVLDLIERHEREVGARIGELKALQKVLRQILVRGRELDPQQCRPEDVCQVVPREVEGA